MEPNILQTPNFKTTVLERRDCHCDWLLIDQEQLSFHRKGLAMPKRCPEYRQAKHRNLSTEQAIVRVSGNAGG